MNLDTALDNLSRNPAADYDPAELALALARDEYPCLDIEAELREVADLAREVRPRLRGGGLTARVEALSRYLFHEQGFEGNQRDYHDPRNSYLNEVLHRRTGLPITLSVLAAAVANRAGLRVEGVGLPGHFIARAVDRNQSVYFDPFNGGRVLSLGDCEKLVESMVGCPFEANESTLAPVPPGYILQRMLSNLKGAYWRRRDFPRAARVIRRLLRLCPGDPAQERDLGTTLLQAGRPGQAIDYLRAYVAREPPPVDRASVRELLREAQTEVSRWN